MAVGRTWATAARARLRWNEFGRRADSEDEPVRIKVRCQGVDEPVAQRNGLGYARTID